MTVKRITTNIAAPDATALAAFYTSVFGLDMVMDLGWIITLAGADTAPIQLSIASQGGSDAPVPALSIEVTDLQATYDRCKSQGYPIAYPLTIEPWGVRRFFVRDPAGALINVMAH